VKISRRPVRDQAEDRAREVMAENQGGGDRGRRVGDLVPGERQAGARCAQHRQERQHGDHGEVLEQQHGERRLSALRAQAAALLERLQRQCGGRKRQRHRGDQRHASGRPEQPAGRGEGGDTAQHLGQSQAQQPPAHAPKPPGFQLQADDEEQEYHAQLGKGADVLHFAHQLEAPGPDGNAGEQVAGHRAQPEPARQQDRDDRGREVDRGLRQQRVAVVHYAGKYSDPGIVPDGRRRGPSVVLRPGCPCRAFPRRRRDLRASGRG
jgi:hypothetical protein